MLDPVSRYHEGVLSITNRHGRSTNWCILDSDACRARRGTGWAPPAACNRLHRIACQLIEKENFDHAKSVVPKQQMGAALTDGNAARIASAMQFFRGFSDHVSLIARAREFVFGWLAAAVATGDRGRAIG